MSHPAIRVENLSKHYRLGTGGVRRTFREAIHAGVAGCVRHLRQRTLPRFWQRREAGSLWALKDVSFTIQPGEVTGIIGRNGAGKSTLLKILSRITEPTDGEVTLYGRVGSLLEVGTGFHSELTGRENIYLNGAILGMTRAEIIRRFDAIVDFAEVERFLDTPVKHYSSGMYMRLAFAVAAHLEPEILLVDEVLAVGDVAFQKKCLGRMGEVARGGRTVIFVSHNMAAIEALSKRCIVLHQGRVYLDEDTPAAVDAYLRLTEGAQESVAIEQWTDRQGTGEARLVKFETCGLDKTQRHAFSPREPFLVILGIQFKEEIRADVAVAVENAKQQALFTTHASDCLSVERTSGYREYCVRVDPNYLRPGRYPVSLAVFSPDMTRFFDVVLHYPGFEIDGYPEEGTIPLDARWGDLYFPFSWQVQ